MASGGWGESSCRSFEVPSPRVLMSKPPSQSERVITLVVDGKRFTVNPSLFTKYPNTMLGRLERDLDYIEQAGTCKWPYTV